ncbi:MAG: N-acetylmuramoyl-L-alanine amidase [Bacteroidales bacterium]|nr:N-acetylmuramoyl-L-alanine amidase [Candidatus Liminaster caballi]
MRKTLFTLLIAIICSIALPTHSLAKQEFVLVIDPGHGGGDTGTPHRKLKMDEKAIALKVALGLGALVKENYPDVKVVYTRKTDIYPTLPERTRTAKEAKGDLFISIHVNAAQDPVARGFETYVFGITGLQGKSEAEQKRIRERTMAERENLDIDGKQVDFETTVDLETKILCQAQREKHNKYSLEVAHYVQDNIMSALHRSSYASKAHNRGVKAKNIYVLCFSPMPAILLELGYMSNTAEEKFINSSEAHTLFAKSIYKGFTEYYSNWKRRQLKDEADEEVKPEQPKPANQSKPAEQTKPVPETKPAPETKPTPETKPVADKVTEPVVSQPAADDSKKPTQTEECYRIQFLSSPKKLEKGDPQLKGLWPVQFYKDGSTYRYTYGEAATKAELQGDIIKIRKLFKDAFCVKFDKNGNRIK